MSKDMTNTLRKYDYVSFDVFDTLIFRRVDKPEEVFQLMQSSMQKRNIEDFCNKRILAERIAIKKSRKQEISLDDIYDQMELPSDLIDAAKEEEIATELQVCEANPKLRNVIAFCREKNKKIIVISDMYLSGEVMGELLHHANIEFDHLFVSSDYDCRKSRGSLYRKVLKELNIKPNQMVHIGDNLRSDYIMAQLNGIRAIWYHEKR